MATEEHCTESWDFTVFFSFTSALQYIYEGGMSLQTSWFMWYVKGLELRHRFSDQWISWKFSCPFEIDNDERFLAWNSNYIFAFFGGGFVLMLLLFAYIAHKRAFPHHIHSEGSSSLFSLFPERCLCTLSGTIFWAVSREKDTERKSEREKR